MFVMCKAHRTGLVGDELETSILDISASSDRTISSVDSSFDVSALIDTAIFDTILDVSLPDVNEFVKKFELKIGLNDSFVLLLTEILKENFLKSTEQMSKLLKDIKKKKDVENVTNKQDDLEKDDISGVPTGVIISEQKSPIKIKSSNIHIKTDIFTEDIADPVNILNELPEEDSDDNAMDVDFGTTFEVSEEKRKFLRFLTTRSQQSLSLDKKNDQYLDNFY